jgi:hypothetical protein
MCRVSESRADLCQGTQSISLCRNRVQGDMRHFRFALGFEDVLDLGETRFKI